MSSMPALPDCGVSLAAKLGEIEIAEDVQALVDGDHDDVAAPRQLGAVEQRAVARAEVNAPPCSHTITGRFAPSPTRRPDVQGQAVLALRRGVGRAGEMLELPAAAEADARLRRLRDVGERVAHAGPGCRLARRHEAAFSRRIRAIWDALEGGDAVLQRARSRPVLVSTSVCIALSPYSPASATRRGRSQIRVSSKVGSIISQSSPPSQSDRSTRPDMSTTTPASIGPAAMPR